MEPHVESGFGLEGDSSIAISTCTWPPVDNFMSIVKAAPRRKRLELEPCEGREVLPDA